MSRRRKRASSADSLELLLDTICNTFGGIVFIALLIVLMLRQTAPLASDQPPEEITADGLETLVGQLESATAELASLRTAEAELSRRAEAFAPDEVRTLLEERNAKSDAVGQLRNERDSRIATNASVVAEIHRGEDELQSLSGKLADVKKIASELEAELESIRESKTEEIRNPVVKASTKYRSLGLIVRYGRMYVWHRYDNLGNRLGLNTDEFVVIEEHGDELVTRPDPTKGLSLEAGNETRTAIGARLSQFSSRDFRVDIVVRPDSFEQFAILRDWLLTAGYEYRLLPSDDGIADRGGSDSRVQ